MISALWANRILGSVTPTIQLHTGDPGPDGTAYVAAGVDRQPVELIVVDGVARNTNTVSWLNVSRMETFTHFTAWDGGLLFSGTVSSAVVFAGDNVFIDPGDLVAFFT